MLLNDHALTCGSLFSGVGGMDIGLAWAGFRHLFFAEIDPYCRAVLAARFPGVHIYDDVRDVACGFQAPDAWASEPNAKKQRGGRSSQPEHRLDLLCGGFPCQDLSVAGKRAGLAGERSGLFHEFMRIADALRPRAILVENVEGLYSSNGGRDFGVVLNALAERGYLVSWRTLDAQHFGVPQRRRRVFVCAVLDGDSGAERIGEVLALQEGSSGDSPTSDPAWPLSAAGAGAGATGGGGVNAVNVERERERVIPAVTAKWAKGSGGPAGDECQNLVWPELSQRPTESSQVRTWARAELAWSGRGIRERERES